MSEASSQGTDALSRRLAELNRQIASTMESAARDVAQVGRRATVDLLEAVTAIDSEDTQNGLLRALVEAAGKLSSRAAFFLSQGEGFVGWGGQGFGAQDGQLAGHVQSPEGPWAEVDRGVVRLDGRACAEFAGGLGSSSGADGLLIPFVLRGQLAGTLYVDRTDGDLAEASLMLLVHTASLAMEIIAFRNRGVSPALRFADGDGDGGGLQRWHGEEATAAAPVAEPAAVEPVVEPEPIAVEPEPVAVEPEPIAVEPEPVAVEPEPIAVEPVAVEPEPESAEEGADPLGYELQGPSFEPTAEDLRPEPELEDTSTGWALEEDDDEDDEPTAVGEQAVQLDPPAAEPEPGAGVSLDQEQPAPGIGQQTVRLDLAEIQGQAAANAQGAGMTVGDPSLIENETATIETPVVDAPLPFSTPEATSGEPSPFEEAPAYVPPPVEPEPEPAPPASFSPEPSSAYVPPPAEPEPSSAYVPPPAEEPAKTDGGGGSTQVRPPENLDGPGSAFRAATETDEALHEEARRLARLLVSEIKLYNEEVIEEGRLNNDIYERLKDDIDRSRQMYQERIDPRLAGRDDYFYQELVQRLAGGDPNVLGMPR